VLEPRGPAVRRPRPVSDHPLAEPWAASGAEASALVRDDSDRFTHGGPEPPLMPLFSWPGGSTGSPATRLEDRRTVPQIDPLNAPVGLSIKHTNGDAGPPAAGLVSVASTEQDAPGIIGPQVFTCGVVLLASTINMIMFAFVDVLLNP